MAAKEFKINRVYTDWRALLDDAKLDIVVIAAPDDLHYPMALAAIERDLQVICERPLATKSIQAYEMYLSAARRGVRTMTYLPWRWFPPVRRAKELIASGYIGKPFYIYSELCTGHRRQTGDYHWSMDRDRANGVIGSIGSDCFDCARWLLGDIARVAASERIVTPYCPQDLRTFRQAGDTASLMVDFENGAHGVIYVTAVGREPKLRLKVEGSDGLIELSYRPRSGHFEFQTSGTGKQSFTKIAPYWAFGSECSGELEDFGENCIQNDSFGERLFLNSAMGDDAKPPSFLEGLRNQRIIDAAMQSVESGSFVNVENRALNYEVEVV